VTDLTVDDQRYALRERLYLLLAAAFSVVLVLTNIIGFKLFQAPFKPDFALTAGIITYPMTFLITDIVSEVYGKKRADFMVLVGFLMSVLMLVVVQIAIYLPPHAYWVPPVAPYFGDGWTSASGAPAGTALEGYQHAFHSVFAFNAVLLVGSMLAYLSAQLIDNYLFHFWKTLTKGKHLWLRNNGSTMVSQLVDTLVVNSILFFIGFGMDYATGFGIMLTIYLYKLVIAALDTPFVYLGVYALQWALGEAE
jgi:queuosine precursor transporter